MLDGNILRHWLNSLNHSPIIMSKKRIQKRFQQMQSFGTGKKYLIYIDGTDPYSLPKSAWTTNLEEFSPISWPNLVMYLVFGRNEFTHTMDEFMACKSLEAYNQLMWLGARNLYENISWEVSLCFELSGKLAESFIVFIQDRNFHKWYFGQL